MKKFLPAIMLSTLCAWPMMAQKMIVAVEKFENKTDARSDYFATLRTRITDEIINTRKFDVVEREQINSVLSELKLKAAGLTEEGEGPEEGKLKSAGFVIYGSVLSLGMDKTTAAVASVAASKTTAKVEVQLRISSAETGKILSSKTIIATKSQSRMAGEGTTTEGNSDDQSIQDAIRSAAKKVTDALIELAYPPKIIVVGKQDITLNLTKEQVEIDDLFDVLELGEELVDPDTGESLGAEEEFIGRIQITTPGPKTSKSKPVGDLGLDTFKPGMLVRRTDPAVLQKEKAMKKETSEKAFKSRF